MLKHNSRPLNNGQIFQAVMPPWLVNWPSETSKIKMGAPASTKQIKYGIRKHPAKRSPHNIVLAWQTKPSVNSEDHVFGNNKKNCQCTWGINKQMWFIYCWCVSLCHALRHDGIHTLSTDAAREEWKREKVGKESVNSPKHMTLPPPFL